MLNLSFPPIGYKENDTAFLNLFSKPIFKLILLKNININLNFHILTETKNKKN